MPDYTKTKIYYISVKGVKYYGHTVQRLCDRKKRHVLAFKTSQSKVYKAMRDANFESKNIELVWVEDYPCKTVEQAKARERCWIENEGELNTIVPQRTREEYYETHKEQYAEWRVQHKQQRVEYDQQYRVDNAEKIKQNKKAYAHQQMSIVVKSPHCDLEMKKPSLKRHIERKHN
jgi:hypothetical protein